MQCPKCRKTKSKVIDSRPAKDKLSIWRRRECLACSTRFTTFEATEVLVSKVTQLEMIELRNKLKQKPDKMPKKAAGKKSKSRKKAPAKKRVKIRRGFIPH
jgi:transcriptional regulator NrdR family protein